jgi:uncharacterized membrane protein
MARRRHGDERRSMLIPLSYAAAAVVAGMVLPRLETHYLPQSHALVNPDAAMAILSAIASGMMALTGIVFSLAFVMVQFSATAYSPRLVLWLARSPVINHSIGVFTATFLYAIAALAWIDRSGITPVPFYTVWVGVLLLLVSVVFFVRLVERVGMLQIGRVLAFIGNQGREIVATLYQPLRPLPGSGGPAAGAVPDLGPVVQEVRHEGAPAAVEALDVPLLEELAGRGEAVIAVAVGVGDTVMDGIPLFRVHGGKALSQARPRDAVLLGRERTFEQDPKYALRLLVDVGIKALSPAINDPTTAVQALDQIGDLLLRLGRSDLDVGRRMDASGRLRVTMLVPTWEDFLGLAIDEIRFCGATSVQVMRRLRALLQDLLAQLPPPRQAAVSTHLLRVDRTIEQHFADADDVRDARTSDRQGLGLSRTGREG